MSTDHRPFDLSSLLETIAEQRDLTPEEAEAAFDRFMDGSASEVQMAAFLMGLRTKGLAPGEIAGGVRALRKAMVPIGVREPARLVDTAGTGGGMVGTFNISTTAAFVAAGAGVPMAKHGNRSFTSRSGSADVLEALGLRIEMSPGRMAEVLEEVGMVFMFAPLLHPAMRHVAPVRRALGITTIMNILGPLTNPAGARRQVVGVADPVLLDLIAGAFHELGHLHALVVHGEPGMDEVSPCGRTRVAEVREGEVREYEITPEDLGFERVSPSDLAGGEPHENAAVVRLVLEGAPGPARTAVLMNAAAAIVASGLEDRWEDAARRAEDSIDDGQAAAVLDRLLEATKRPE